MLELYNLKEDFSQTTDLAAKYPKKVKEMKKMFIAEAKKFQVFPMERLRCRGKPPQQPGGRAACI